MKLIIVISSIFLSLSAWASPNIPIDLRDALILKSIRESAKLSNLNLPASEYSVSTYADPWEIGWAITHVVLPWETQFSKNKYAHFLLSDEDGNLYDQSCQVRLSRSVNEEDGDFYEYKAYLLNCYVHLANGDKRKLVGIGSILVPKNQSFGTFQYNLGEKKLRIAKSAIDSGEVVDFNRDLSSRMGVSRHLQGGTLAQ